MEERCERAEAAVKAAIAIAEDNTHGYDQNARWGPDYDCSSLVIHCWRVAGVPLECSYTGDMRGDMLRRGFADVTGQVELSRGEGLVRGDVLLNAARHTALYIGEGRVIHASANERGMARGGKSGDQTGREICERGYYNYPWDCVLRYMPEKDNANDKTPDNAENARKTDEAAAVSMPTLRVGAVGATVAAMQGALLWHGHDPRWIDGEFGERTRAALSAFQRGRGITPEGVCAGETWSALFAPGEVSA